VKKKYVAQIHGELKESEGSIKLPLAPDVGNNPRQKVDYENGKESHTDFRVLTESEHPDLYFKYKDQFPAIPALPHSLVELTPHTGRYFPVVCITSINLSD
jgi:tRNA pseudouridine32 synthase/23S rRNA pseudouridine746 synthase